MCIRDRYFNSLSRFMKTDLFFREDLSYENESGNTRSPDDLSDCGNRIMWFCAGDYCGPSACKLSLIHI